MTPLPLSLFPGPGVNLLVTQGSVAGGGVWEGKEGWVGLIRNPGPGSSSLEVGIILPSEPPPHWLVPCLVSSFRLGPWHRGYSFFGVAGPLSWGLLAVHLIVGYGG